MKYFLMLAIFVMIFKSYGCDSKEDDQLSQEGSNIESRYFSFWGKTCQQPVFVINPFVLSYANEVMHVTNRKMDNRRLLHEVLPGVNNIHKSLIHAGQSVVHLLKGVGETALGVGGAAYGSVIGALAGAGSGAVMGAQKGMIIAAGSGYNSSEGVILLNSDEEDKEDDDHQANATFEDEE